jgi:hypothetical protein
VRSGLTRARLGAFVAVSLVGGSIVVAALSACTPAAPASSPPPSHTTTAAGGLPPGVEPAPVPTDVPNVVALRKHVTMTACAGDADGWHASGTASNPSKKDAKYTITVFFTTRSATVIDTASTTVEVAPGGREKWTATKDFTTGGQLNCVLRGVG